MSAPVRTPKILMTESVTTKQDGHQALRTQATSMLPNTIGPQWNGGTCATCQIQFFAEIAGKKTPRNLQMLRLRLRSSRFE